MQHTNKWIPVLILFFMFLLCGILLFAALRSHAGADAGTQTDNPTDTSEPAGSASSAETSQNTASTPSDTSSDTASSPEGTSNTAEDTPPPALDLTAELPLYNAAGEQIDTLTIEEYLCGALLSTMSFTYPPSALETQAIALRTDTWRRIVAGGVLSTETYGYTDREALLPTWGADFTATIWERAANAVSATRGVVLCNASGLYGFDVVGETGVSLAATDIGKRAKTATTDELLAFFYPSATFTKNT